MNNLVSTITAEIMEACPLIACIPDEAGILFPQLSTIRMSDDLPIYAFIQVKDHESEADFQGGMCVVGHVLSYRKQHNQLTIRFGWSLEVADDFPLLAVQQELGAKIRQGRVKMTYSLNRDSVRFGADQSTILSGDLAGFVLYE